MNGFTAGLIIGLVFALWGSLLANYHVDVDFTADDVDEYLLVCKNNHEVKTYHKDNSGTITVRCNDGAIFERESGK